MIKTKEVPQMVKVVDGFICDKCGIKITKDDMVEWQEVYSIRFTGGYGSLFGDMSRVTCDLCQQCLYDLIKYHCFVDGERLDLTSTPTKD